MSAEPHRNLERDRARAYAALTFAWVAPLTYVSQRLLERARAPIDDPGLILIATHMGYVWRSIVAAWFGAACAGLVYVTKRDATLPIGHVQRTTAMIFLVGIGLALAAVRLP